MSISYFERPARCSAALQQWRSQIGSQRTRRFRRGARPLAVLTCSARRRAVDDLVPLYRATFLVLYDTECPAKCIRFAGYRAMEVPNGVLLGGADQIRFEKNLALSPAGIAKRPSRFSARDKGLLVLALEMDRALERHSRYPYFPRPNQFRLPPFWAAVTAKNLAGEGPEFDAVCKESGRSPGEVLWASSRSHGGQTLYPLEFVSHAWRYFAGVYVDLKSLPRRQVIRLDRSADLSGFSGACEFDFLNSRYRTCA